MIVLKKLLHLTWNSLNHLTILFFIFYNALKELLLSLSIRFVRGNEY